MENSRRHDDGDTIEKVVSLGVFAKPLVEHYLDIDNLTRAYGEVAADASTKRDEIERATAIAQRRHDNVKSAVEHFFGLDRSRP